MDYRWLLCAGLCALAIPSQAQDGTDLARLARDVDRAQAIRDIRDLGGSYAQYSQFGMWNDMAGLFADKAEFIDGDVDLHGRPAIQAYMLKKFGGGRDGLAKGGVATRLEFTPVINLSADGNTAKGRWHELAFLGQYGGSASFEGAIQENDYVKENGVWKIQTFHSYPQFAGPYETGWRNVVPDLKIIPYHYTSESAGIPVPPAPGGGLTAIADAKSTLHAVSAHVARMTDEDAVRNLENIYGYYADRKMWSDVVDLFSTDGSMELAGTGIYDGPVAIRRALEMQGPEGIKAGEVADQMLMNEIVDVMPGGMEARMRGLSFSQTGDVKKGTAGMGLEVFDNRFVKVNGTWRIREMRIYPIMETDYYQGWGKSQLPPASATKEAPPSRPSTFASGGVPEFFLPNPGTAQPVALPKDTHVVANDLLLPAVAKAKDYPDLSVADAQHRLDIAKAYDATVNISSAFGNYVDDFQWQRLADAFASTGLRQKVDLGFYMGPGRIITAEKLRWGDPPSPRTSIPIHLREQPVIFVAPDGLSTHLRTRLFSIGSSLNRAGDFGGEGMYPNDGAVFENGAWRLTNAGIDEFYWQSHGWKDGWARGVSWDKKPQPKQSPILAQFKPDIVTADMQLRQYGFETGPGPLLDWPYQRPMWFSYRNPVSGRTPPLYCPEIRTCYKEKRLQLTGREEWMIQP